MSDSPSWYTPTTRARTVPSGLNGTVTSATLRVLLKSPPPTDTVPVKSRLTACLRTRLIEADGLPEPVNRPVAPRTTSTRSYSATSSAESP